MKVLRLKLYQNLCNYRKENCFKYIQTYPLPTPSMIRGMIHEIMDLKEYEPFSVSIQGESDAIITNIQKVYKFDRDPKSRPQNPYRVLVKNSIKTAVNGILFIDLHVNINLKIHIKFNDDNELNLERLLKEIQNKIVVLGRNEDFALVEDAKIIELKEFSGRNVKTLFPMYVPAKALLQPEGIAFRLPFWYENVNSFQDNRIFHFVDSFYVGKDVQLKKEFVFEDDEKNIVCFLNSPEK